MALPELEYVTLSSQLFERLRKEIIVSNELKGGTFIRENEVAERLGVSRAPVREALKQMETMGLVVSIPRKGVQVRLFSRKELDELYEMREALEGLVFKEIVEKRLFTPEVRQRFENMLEDLFDLCRTNESREEKIIVFCDGDLKFHRSLAELSGKQWTTRVLESLYYQIHLALLQEMRGIDSLEDVVQLHYSIINHLATGDLKQLTEVRRYSYFDRRNKALDKAGRG